jgi:hypothetical protein
VIHLPHLVQESVYSVGHPPLHARYHQAGLTLSSSSILSFNRCQLPRKEEK